jgi:hypothetical protein
LPKAAAKVRGKRVAGALGQGSPLPGGGGAQLDFPAAIPRLTGEGSQLNLAQAAIGGSDSFQHETESEDGDEYESEAKEDYLSHLEAALARLEEEYFGLPKRHYFVLPEDA